MNRDDGADGVQACTLATVKQGGLLSPGAGVLVLLSGGRDSVCLLDLAVRLVGCPDVTALHVNYGLRDGADDDERHCIELCSQLGVDLAVEHVQAPIKGNLQAWARDLRYARAAVLALGSGATIATGHTASDQAETVLYRLAASPGRRALLGMSPRDGLLIRPLLELTREQTGDYCAARGLSWRDDPSNESDRFARGRLRTGLLPALRAIHPAAEANVVETARLLRDESVVLDSAVNQVLEGASSIELARLAGLEPALARLVVRRLAEQAAGHPAAGVARRLDDLIALSGRPGSAALDVGAGLRAHIEYGVLRFATTPLDSAQAPLEQVLLAVPGSVRLGGYEVMSSVGSVSGQLPSDGQAREDEDGPWSVTLDASALGTDLLVRPWRHGDRMRPVGVGGTRSLQDLFTDRRVPRARRGSVPVVVAGDEIVWIAGVAVAEPFVVTTSTTATTRLSAKCLASD